MSFKMKGVPGAKKSDYAATMPMLSCDSKGCKNTVEGNPGMKGKEFVNDRAHSMGWHQANGTDTCADCLTKKLGPQTAPMSGAAVIGMIQGGPKGTPPKTAAKGK